MALQPSWLYSLADARTLAKAATYFARDPITTIAWGDSGRLLLIELGPSSEVRIVVPDGPLLANCTCGGDLAGGGCIHIIAVLMTLMRVTRGSRFHKEDLRASRVSQFREMLAAPAPTPDKPRLLIDEMSPGPAMEYDSGRREASWRIVGPPEGMEWLRLQDSDPAAAVDGFLAWVEERPGAMLVEIRAGGTAWQIEDLRRANFSGEYVLSHDGREIVCTVVTRNLPDLRPCDGVHLGTGLYFDPAGRSVGLIRNAEALAVAFGRERCLSVEAFNRRPMLEPFDGLRCMHGTVEVQPLRCDARGWLDVQLEDRNAEVAIRVKGDPGELPTAQRFHDLLVHAIQRGRLPEIARSARRARRFCELAAIQWTMGASHNSETAAAVRSDPAFGGEDLHGRDAALALESLGEALRTLNLDHLLAAESAQDWTWVVCRNAGNAIGAAWAALADGLPTANLLRCGQFGVTTTGNSFAEAVSGLVAACERHGVDLTLNNKPVRLGHLDITVSGIRSGGDDEPDWFDLHPEARAGSLVLSPERWNQILQTGSFHDEDGELCVLPASDLQRLAAASDAHESGGGLLAWLALREKGIKCVLPPEDEVVLQALRGLDAIPTRPSPGQLKAELRDYQRHGYEWLSFLYENRFGACLADDMGLGKTVQIIALLAGIREGIVKRPESRSTRPHLVVAPATLIFNWQSELARFAPDLRVREVTSADRWDGINEADVAVATYERIRRDVDLLGRYAFDVAVFDEAQFVKNAAAQRTQALQAIRAGFRACLTGTPMENSAAEFQSVISVAIPGIFGARSRLRKVGADPAALDRARPFVLRRRKAEILRDLPEKVESNVLLPLSPEQKELYTRLVGEVREEVLAAYGSRTSGQAGIVALAALLRLRQVCIAPAMIDRDSAGSSPKIDHLVEQIEALHSEGHAALVFSQFVRALDLAALALQSTGVDVLRLDGSMPIADRKSIVERFQTDSSIPVLLISLKVGGAGLNLTRASYVFHLDPWWNPAVEDQATARAHRLGQSRSVFVQRLLMRHTVEEKIMALKARKQALFEEIVEGNTTAHASGASALTAADFRFLTDPE